MIVVSNSGPLIALAKIDRLTLIGSLYGEVLIPKAVEQEVIGRGADRPGAKEVAAASWIQPSEVLDRLAVSLLREQLDAGESEAIVLALARQANILLIDEARGRRIAQAKGLTHIGTVGILVLAKRRGLLKTVTPDLDQLIASGFRMDDALKQTAQRLAGE